MKRGLAMCIAVASMGALSFTTGCTNLPNVEADDCGNLVLDAEEDCDGFPDDSLGDNLACGAPETENECAYVCDPAEGQECPVGWGCGSDFRCRRAAGTFEEAPSSPWRFPVEDFAMGDVDGDGNADLIGNDLSSVTVRFGEETGEFPSRLDLLTATPEGPLSFSHFDSDGKLDVVVPISSGLFVLLGDEDRDLSPVAYAPFDVEQDLTVKFLPLESYRNNIDTEIVTFVHDKIGFVHNLDSYPATTMPSGHNTGEIVGRPPTADVHVNTRLGTDNSGVGQEGRHEVAVTFSGENKVWIYTTAGTLPPAPNNMHVVLLDTIALPPGGTISLGTTFADVDADGWVDLMVSVKPLVGSPRVAVAYNNGNGDFDDAKYEAVFDRQQGAAWPLAAGDLNDDGYADYVLAEAILLSVPPAIGGDRGPARFDPVVFAASQPFSEAVFGDFNGDTFVDVATAVEGRDGVDVFLNTGFGPFNKFHVDTEDPPRSLGVGDFDGDLLDDVVFISSGFGAKPDELTVVFGQHDSGPSDPVSMGALGFIETVEPIQAVRSLESVDLISDLFVLSNSFPDRATRSAAVLTGNSSRRMTSPFSLESGDSNVPDVPLAALVGNFNGDADGVKDIVSIADVPQNINIDGGTGELGDLTILKTNLWMVPGTKGDGSLDSSGAAFIEAPDFDDFRTDCATWAAGNLDTTGNFDEIIGVDNNATCFGLGFSPEPRLMVIRTEGGLSATVSAFPSDYRAPRELELRDLDNDGDADLLVLFVGEERGGSSSGTNIEGAAVVVLWNNDGNLSTQGASVLTIPNGNRLHDVAALNIDDDPIPELVVLADGGVFVADFDADTAQYLEPRRVIPQQGDGRIAAGDTNGDGLVDIAFTIGSDVHVYLQQAQGPIGAATPATNMGGGQ